MISSSMWRNKFRHLYPIHHTRWWVGRVRFLKIKLGGFTRQCKKMEFVPAETLAVPSYSKQRPGSVYAEYSDADRFYSPGNGWVYVSYSARIILDLTDLETGDEEEADISKFVRHHIGRITIQRVERLKRTKPVQVAVTNGCVAEADMNAWLERFCACKGTIAKSM